MARTVLFTRTISRIVRSVHLSALLCVAASLTAQSAWAQGGGGTIGTGASSGVVVDADGVLRRVTANDPTGDLARQRAQEAILKLDRNVAHRSPLRKISLTRLDRVMKDRLASGAAIDDTMKNLAGLTRVEYVFCYPASGDIVIAGPAEAWGQAPSGRMQGIDSGRPIIELQDL